MTLKSFCAICCSTHIFSLRYRLHLLPLWESIRTEQYDPLIVQLIALKHCLDYLESIEEPVPGTLVEELCPVNLCRASSFGNV